MRCLNREARAMKGFLQDVAGHAGLSTDGVSVYISSGERNPPHAVGGRISIPSMRLLDQDVRIFAQTWLHELQHANDYLAGSYDMGLEEAEQRAREAERLVSDDVFEMFFARHREEARRIRREARQGRD